MAIGSHPLSFKLLNLDGNAILGIFDGKGQTSKLNIKNTSRRDWLLKKLPSDMPSADNHHFELKFRLGTLNLNQPIKVDETDVKWKISNPIKTPDGISFYLLSANPFTVKKEEGAVVMLHNLNADGSDGARGTRVEFKWSAQLKYAGSDTSELPAGHRVQHLSIVNDRGEKAPLAVRIVSTDRVVNDGTTENKLTLRIASLIKEDINLYPENDPVYPASKFTFWFDTQTKDADKEWTLASTSQLEKLEFVVSTEMKPGRGTQGTAPSWWITPKERSTLTPGKSIEVTFNKITTSNPAGKCNLYARCENIPGYRDGDFVSLVEKSPVAYKEQNVGIGTTDPQAKLDVKGKVRVDGEASISGKVGLDTDVHIKGKLRVDGQTSIGGKVGIGTDGPEKALHVKGTGDQEIMIQSEDSGGAQWALQSSKGSNEGRFEIINRSAGLNTITILKDGNVGIGTIEPTKHLHVRGTGDQEIMIESTDTNGIQWSLQSSAGANEGRFEIINRSSGHNRFSILKDGKVGIGVANPTKGILEVSGWIGTVVDGFGFLNKGGGGSTSKRETNAFSIWASDRMGALEFNAFSDERMKNIRGRSDTATDLGTLLGIEITDYSHKDVIGKGNGSYKKVIGQQVEKVFPQAVSRNTDVVPDIYQQASIRDGWVTLATELKKGDRVKLITAKGEDVHEVLEVAPDKFRVDLDHEDDAIFVFGREVNDFLTVDYDAIAMLNVSATQQLKKELDHEVKVLRAENAELRATNDELARRLELLESRLNAMLSVAGAGNGSNGNGRH